MKLPYIWQLKLEFCVPTISKITECAHPNWQDEQLFHVIKGGNQDRSVGVSFSNFN